MVAKKNVAVVREESEEQSQRVNVLALLSCPSQSLRTEHTLCMHPTGSLPLFKYSDRIRCKSNRSFSMLSFAIFPVRACLVESLCLKLSSIARRFQWICRPREKYSTLCFVASAPCHSSLFVLMPLSLSLSGEPDTLMPFVLSLDHLPTSSTDRSRESAHGDDWYRIA